MRALFEPLRCRFGLRDPPNVVKHPSRFPLPRSGSVPYGIFVWARGARKHKKRRFPARAVMLSWLGPQPYLRPPAKAVEPQEVEP